MGRAIDADALMKAMYHRAFETDGDTMWQSGCWVRYRAIEQTVKEQPTIEPKRKTGKWETVEDWDGDEHYRCSECGAEFVLIDGTPENNDYYFCPHCGARMTEEDV